MKKKKKKETAKGRDPNFPERNSQSKDPRTFETNSQGKDPRTLKEPVRKVESSEKAKGKGVEEKEE